MGGGGKANSICRMVNVSSGLVNPLVSKNNIRSISNDTTSALINQGNSLPNVVEFTDEWMAVIILNQLLVVAMLTLSTPASFA